MYFEPTTPPPIDVLVPVEFAGALWELTVSYNPGYEAPNVRCHDNPYFGDPGCGAEWSVKDGRVTVDGQHWRDLEASELDEVAEKFDNFIGERAAEAYAQIGPDEF